VPLLSSSEPDVPDDAAFTDANSNDPVLLLVLLPPNTETDPPTSPLPVAAPPSTSTPPPVPTVDVPADTNTAPPAPLLPVPTLMLTAPPLPLTAEPVIRLMEPELPYLAVPVLTRTAPEIPLEPAFAVVSRIQPVELLVLPPLCSSKSPPASPAAEVAPADRTMAPPAPLLPLPTSTLIAPPLPPVAKPDSSAKYPEFPEPVLPLLNVTDPDTPDDAAFDDASTTAPVPLLVLPPDTIDTDPPT